MSTSPEKHPQRNPLLTATLLADYEAVRNDLRQAQAIASDYQRQLAGKSNDHAQLKMHLERAHADLISLQGAIQELRAERHSLANDVQRLYGLEQQLLEMTEERDKMTGEMDGLRQSLSCAHRTIRELWDAAQKNLPKGAASTRKERPVCEPASPRKAAPKDAKVSSSASGGEKQVIGLDFLSGGEVEIEAIPTENKGRRR